MSWKRWKKRAHVTRKIPGACALVDAETRSLEFDGKTVKMPRSLALPALARPAALLFSETLLRPVGNG
jgi:hypothetical protein